jgi:5-methylcytosine-specific restriction endonuclease McrA
MSLEASTAVKKAANANNPDMKLDHTIPLELGGSNSADNLKVVTTAEWSSYTSVENALAKALKNNKINKNEAQRLIREFKDGKLSKEDVLNRIK